jgi:hypothetical protein
LGKQHRQSPQSDGKQFSLDNPLAQEYFFIALLLALLFRFFLISNLIETRKEQTIMATKKPIILWSLVNILIVAVWLLAVVTQAGAETMRARSSNSIVKMEAIAVGDVDAHHIGVGTRDGLAFFESGEVATLKSFTTWDLIGGKGGWVQGYSLFTFVDGSTIFTTVRQEYEPDPEGRFTWNIKFTGQIVKGTGRFEGIKGTLSGTGKRFKTEKGELMGKQAQDWTFIYTLPPK